MLFGSDEDLAKAIKQLTEGNLVGAKLGYGSAMRGQGRGRGYKTRGSRGHMTWRQEAEASSLFQARGDKRE